MDFGNAKVYKISVFMQGNHSMQMQRASFMRRPLAITGQLIKLN